MVVATRSQLHMFAKKMMKRMRSDPIAVRWVFLQSIIEGVDDFEAVGASEFIKIQRAFTACPQQVQHERVRNNKILQIPISS